MCKTAPFYYQIREEMLGTRKKGDLSLQVTVTAVSLLQKNATKVPQ